MWRVILLGFCYHVLSQPATDEPSTRHTRELIECCPCPGSNLRALSHGGQDMLGRASDDCPCRPRTADSEGASSLFFPTRTAPGRSDSVPFMRSNDPIDDMKNLLEPEVGLATSMLQTLREATEEEYLDALARDAARAADAVPEESARNVVIIVKPKPDEDFFLSEVSNVKEPRCINPVGSSLSKMRTASKPLKTLPDFLRFPKARQPLTNHRNMWDMDSNVGASNIQTSVVDVARGSPELKYKLGTPLKQNPLKSSNNSDEFKIPSVFDKLEESLKNRPNLFERFNLPLKVDNPLTKPNNNMNTNSDPDLASSNAQGTLNDGKEKGIFKFNRIPHVLRNLIKQKDVEIIQKSVPKTPTYMPRLKNKESLGRDADDHCEDLSYDSAMNEKVLMPKNVPAHNQNSDTINMGRRGTNQQNNIIESEQVAQDAIPSPSEITETSLDNIQTNTVELVETDCNSLLPEEIIASTTEFTSKALENETLDPTQESEIVDIGENQEDSDIDSSCETAEELENENDDSDTDSSINIEQAILLNTHNIEESTLLSQRPEYDEDSILSSPPNVNGDSNVLKAEDKTQIIEPESSAVVGKKIITKIPPLSKTLSTINDNVKKSIENFKQTTKNLNLQQLQEDIGTKPPVTNNLNQEKRILEAVEETDTFKSGDKEITDQVTFKDLQKLSNDLLVLSSNQELNLTPKDAEVADEISKSETEPQSNSFEPELTTLSETGTIETTTTKSSNEKLCSVGFGDNKKKQTTVQQFISSQDENSKDLSAEASAPNAKIFPPLINPLNLNEKSGPVLGNLDPLKLSEKLKSSMFLDLDPLKLNEKLASPLLQGFNSLSRGEKLISPILPDIDPLNLNENLESSLLPNLDPLNVRFSLQDMIVQPAGSDGPLNLLGKPLTEVLKLPTLEDIRQLTSVFDGNDRSAENNFSDEDGDCTNDAPEMALAASTTNLRKVPSLQPLEDLNVDLFQLNPLSSSQSDFLSKGPRLNLNNFRAKLPIPNNLDLKPVKLESKVANNKGNIVGASLIFGNGKAKQSPANILGKPIGNLPTLEELQNTLHSGTRNLLGTPLQPNLDLFKKNNPGSSNFLEVDEIRRNAEKTVKGLQRRMKSTFKGGQLYSPLGETYAKPQDFFEDVSDKLKAIHYDLNDRLSSIHEDILDKSRFKPITSPTAIPFPSNRNSNQNVMNTIRKPKVKPARLQTSASTITHQEIDPFENADNDRTFMLSEARSNPKIMQTNPHRTLMGAGSSPLPTVRELPKPISSIETPKKTASLRLPSLRQGAENIFPQKNQRNPLSLPRQQSFVKDLKRPILGKPRPFKDKISKVTITFATTTPSPVTTPVDKLRITPAIKPYKSNTHVKPNGDSLKEKLSFSAPNTFRDAKKSASEFSPSIISTPVKSKNNFKTANSDFNNLPQLQSLKPNVDLKSRLSSSKFDKHSKPSTDSNGKIQNPAVTFENNKPEMNKVESSKPLVWPKSGEDSFLAKVREAMQARLNSFNFGKAAKKVELPKVKDIDNADTTDMTRSASENNDVVFAEEPLKENVSYKCKMVCTRGK